MKPTSRNFECDRSIYLTERIFDVITLYTALLKNNQRKYQLYWAPELTKGSKEKGETLISLSLIVSQHKSKSMSTWKNHPPSGVGYK